MVIDTRDAHARSAPTGAGPGRRRPEALVVAYACEPGRGSEPGAGWGLVRAASEFANCTILVGPEHVPGIRAWEASHGGEPFEFIEVPEPGWARVGKWHRIPWFLLYLGWLRNARRAARALVAERSFDVAFHATYATYWLPSPATELGLPSVWGPVGGAVVTPWRLWPILGWRGVASEVLDLVSVRFASLWPRTRRTWRRASVRLVQNEETRSRLPRRLQADTRVLNHAGFVEIAPASPRQRGSHLLCVSPLQRRKAPNLAVRALAQTPDDVQLWMVGAGPERARLERLAGRLGVAHRIRLLGQVPRAQLSELFAEAAAAVFTGVREEGGLALAEAMVLGTPVIVLDHGGPRALAASAGDDDRVRRVAPGTIRETVRRLAEAMTAAAKSPASSMAPLLDQAAARRALRESFERLGFELGQPGAA